MNQAQKAILKHAQQSLSEADFERVGTLRASILQKASGIPWLRKVMDDISVILDLIQDYCSGRYRQIPAWVVATLAFALLYFINPVELIPEFIPVVGYLDDIALLLLALRMTRRYVAAYKSWRTAQTKAGGIS